MKSPFPGMDPYLEARWGDVHTTLMVYASNQLNGRLADDLVARVEESLAPQRGNERMDAVGPEADVADEPRTERHLEIIDVSDGDRVVTAIEILSPEDKITADGQFAYIRKQRGYLEAGVNLVEIDLVRAGGFVVAVPQERLPESCRTPYLVCIHRATRRDGAEFYPIPLRQTLPNIPVPLRPSDKDAVLQLQPLIDACYRDGRYHRLNCRVDPTPRLGDADARWVDEVLRAAGRR